MGKEGGLDPWNMCLGITLKYFLLIKAIFCLVFMCLAALPQLFLWKLGDLCIVLRHVCHPVLFHAGSFVLWLLEKLLFCLTHVGEKNSQDNFWKKNKKARHRCLTPAAWQPWYEASLGVEQELDFVALNPPLEGPFWHCCSHQKPSLSTWESERRAGTTPPWVQLGCRILEAALAPRKTSWRLYSLASGSSWLAMFTPI